MAKIDKTLMRQWADADVFHATDYNRERDIIVEAVNDIENKLTATSDPNSYVTQQILDDALEANATGDHRGTWQGYNPSSFVMVGTNITPQLIGAATQDDINALQNQINTLINEEINLGNYPRLAGETNDKARFQRAIDGTPAGGTLVVPAGSYTFDSIVVNKPINIIFDEQTTVTATAPNVDILTFQGTAGANNYILVNPLNRGDRTFRLTRYPTDIAPGDMIILRDDTVRVTDGQTNVNVEAHEVTAVTPADPNLVTASAMNADSDADGVVDGFTATANGSPTYTKTLNTTEQAQEINITASASAGAWAGVYQEVPVTAGNFYNFGADVKVDSAATVQGRFYIEWYNNSGTLSQYSTYTTITPSGTWQTLRAYNQQAPTGATKARCYFQAYCPNGGETGKVWFKNAVLQGTNTDVTIRDFVRIAKSVSSSSNVYKVTPLEGVRVHNFQYQLPEGSTTGRGLFFDMVRNPIVTNLAGTRGAGSAVFFQRTMYAIVDGFKLTNAQVTGSGQGYGIQFYGGNNAVIVKNGFCWGMRHAVDFDSTHGAIVENVFSYNAAAADFILSHNGWTSDITYVRCRAIHGSGQGFSADSQGVSDPLSLTFYNMNVIDCEVVTASSAQAGVHFYSPCQNSIVRGLKMRYLNGAQGNYNTMGNSGIRVYPGKSEILIEGCRIEGVRRGIALQAASGVSNFANDSSRIIVRDCIIRNADAVFLIEKVTSGMVQFYNINADNITGKVFEFSSSPTFRSFVVDGLGLSNSASAVFYTGTYTQLSDGTRGVIRNIRTDRTNSVSVSSGWTLSDSNIYLYGDGETVLLNGGVASASSGNVFPNALVEGQRLFIINNTTSGITINAGSNIVFKSAATSTSIASNTTPIAQFIWRGGSSGKWYQV